MAESNRKLPEPLQAFVEGLKERLIKTETTLREMRAREASTKERKLEKHELCPLCGGPEVNARCACIEKLQKNAVMGYGPSTPGSGMPSNTGLGASGGGGTQPMGLSEPAYKNEMCKNCGYEHAEGKHGLKKDAAGLSDVSTMSKHQMPSSSAAATAPAAPKPATPLPQVNRELGGFQSLAGMSPVGGGKLAPSNKINIGTAGRRAGNPVHATSGTLDNNAVLKGEKNFGSARSPYGTGAKGHASTANYPSAIKERLGKLGKDEKEMAPTPAVPEKAVKGAKEPKKGKDATPAKQGSGGEIKKGASLRKDAMSEKAPEVKGTSGKQPVGKGGGDAAKMPAAKPMNTKLPAAAGSGSAKSGLKAPAPGPATKPAPKGPDALRRAGSAEVGRMIADKGAAAEAAKAPIPSVDVDVSDFDKGPNRLAPNPTLPGDVGRQNFPQKQDALTAVRGDLNLAADKKAAGAGGFLRGGVDFLRGLMSMVRGGGASGQPTGRGMAPAPGVSVDQAVRQLGGNNGNVTVPTDSTGGVRTQPAGQPTAPLRRAPMTRFRGAMPLQRSEAAWDLGPCVFCNGPEHAGNCK